MEDPTWYNGYNAWLSSVWPQITTLDLERIGFVSLQTWGVVEKVWIGIMFNFNISAIVLGSVIDEYALHDKTTAKSPGHE